MLDTVNLNRMSLKKKSKCLKKNAGLWWHTPLTAAPGRQKQAEARLVNILSSKTAKSTQGNPVSEERKKPQKTKIECL